MKRKSWFLEMAVAFSVAVPGWAGTFGKVVAIGGHASDLALDEVRGVLYVANFTANRIEVMSLADNSVQRSINVPPQPSNLAISPDGRYLIAVHYGNFTAPASPNNAITLINLNNDQRQTFALGNPPLGVAFGIDGNALIVTTKEIIVFDPLLGTSEIAGTIQEVAAKALPQPPATFPNTIKSAAMGVSGDGLRVFVFGDGITFRYDVGSRTITPGGFVFSGGPVGPRVVSVNQDGSKWMGAWMLIDDRSTFISWLESTTQNLDVGTNLIDSARGLIYAQVLETGQTAQSEPILKVLDGDNLFVRDRLRLPENFAGRSVLSSDGNTMYGVSDSGVMILPVGAIGRARRINAAQEDMVFRGNFCDRSVASQSLIITDLSGAGTPFRITTTQAGISFSPSSGMTPAAVRVTVDPSAFANTKGTVSAAAKITSDAAVNVPKDVRILVNSREPDQRGSFINIPGTLTDIVADPSRDRFFVLRRSHNDVLVFDGSTFIRVAQLRTGNSPTQMAITFDRRYLLVSNSASWTVSVYDLETLEALPYIRVPMSPVSIATTTNSVLLVGVDDKNNGWILRADMATRRAQLLPALGIFENGKLKPDGHVVSAANGSSVLFAQSDGTVMLYSAAQDTFTAARKDATALSGAIAASSFDQYVAGNRLMNASLVTTRQLDTTTGQAAGFAFMDEKAGIWIGAPNASSAGVMARVNLETGEGQRATRMIEAPVLSSSQGVFTRALAPLANRNAYVALTTSGFTALPWNYDAAVAAPRIASVQNAADRTNRLAPGGLISVYGENLSPVNQVSSQIPLPTALGDSCLTVNGLSVPILFVSPSQVNAQLPFNVAGNATLRLNTPGGVSDNYNLTIQPVAPSVFRAGAGAGIPAVIRERNGELVTPSNPIHRNGDVLTIYATGLGRTTPQIESGMPAPADTLISAEIPPAITLGGVPLQVTFAGLAPGYVGLYQINVLVNGRAPLGLEVPFTVSQGTGATTFNVRVID